VSFISRPPAMTTPSRSPSAAPIAIMVWRFGSEGWWAAMPGPEVPASLLLASFHLLCDFGVLPLPVQVHILFFRDVAVAQQIGILLLA